MDSSRTEGALAGRSSGDVAPGLRELESRLGGWFQRPESRIPEEEFGAVALQIFELQFLGNEAYRRYCESRGRTPASVSRWEDVPSVPATAFKYLDLLSAPGRPEAVFLTSGTTRGGGRRGRHPVSSLGLYRDACVPWFAMNLVPEGGRLPILSLVPSPRQDPHSSLSAMMGFVSDALGTVESGFFARPESGIRVQEFRRALIRSEGEGVPVLAMGTAFAWVQWLERCGREGWSFDLPEGSRLMETGGFKGRTRRVPRSELYRGLEAALGIPAERMVNEYGMTELLSQLYEPVLRPASGKPREADPGERVHLPPPWLRVRVLDPETLAPRKAGERGLLAFFDAANLASVSAILTEDLGWMDDDGLRLVGRAEGAEPRGCSLAMEELLEGVP
jgi:hypothetical protein